MKLTDRLHRAAAPVWAGYLAHPFVTGMGDGTLDPEKFRFFLLQDYVYLFDYARVFALGVVKAESPDLMRRFARSVDETLDGEMSIHRAYMARLGISEDRAARAMPARANRSYTSYMLSVAYAGGAPEIAAAILACSWSYAEIGAALARRPGAAEHPLFGEWISGYAGCDYQAANDGLIRLMDRLEEDCTERRKDALTDIFVTCSRYEAGFWDMAWTMEM